MTSNCLASVSIGCLFCCQRCDILKIQIAFTFLPPQPSYTLDIAAEASHGKLVYLADALKTFGFYLQAADHAVVSLFQTRLGERCPLVWVRPSKEIASYRPGSIVLLHCHGNATDIGMMMGPYFEMAKQLEIEVVGIEYSGYGASSGSPSPAKTYADVEAAYDHIIAQGVPPERVIAYGQSVGSGPAAYIASKHKIGGLILHSPLMSGIKVIDPQPDRCCKPSCMFGCCDFYPTDKCLKTATCPTFIIHGQLDDIVPFYHGHRLSEMPSPEYRWPGYFPANAGHNDIVESNVNAYFQELGKFIKNVQQLAGSAPSAEVQERPMQIEMQTPSAGVLGVREADRLQDNGGNEGTQLTYAEPKVGPEDGMYANMRREKPSPSV